MNKQPVAIVTGASKGIGKACAIGLSQKGYKVALVARNQSLLHDVANEIKTHPSQEPMPSPSIHVLDLTQPDKIPALIKNIYQENSRIDLLINNAGIGCKGTLTTSLAEFESVMNTNLLAPFALLKEVVPIMKQQGRGHIINIASRSGKVGFANNGVYGASKFGLVGLNESLYRELSQDGISVTALCPGWVNTEMAYNAGVAFEEDEMIQPQDIMNTVDWILNLSPHTCVKEVVLELSKSIA